MDILQNPKPSAQTTIFGGSGSGGASFGGFAGGLIGGALNVATTLFGNRARKRALDDARRYNHPAQQMKRLQEAGLNPNLVYGEGVSGASGNMEAQQQVEDPKIDALAKIMMFQKIKLEGARADNLNLINRNLAREIRLKELDVQKKDASAPYWDDNARYDSAFQQKRAEEQFWKAGVTEEQWNYLVSIRDTRVQKFVDEAIKAKHGASNEEKLGILRGLEAHLKEAQIKFYDANQIVRILTQILGLRR